ncbi:DUF1294 domain-containing protein [Paenibacillus sp. N1-5-1-14]|uniref:DUF1294 domain-containing protein n=1 Tax=Paenibacillus radicibacter TaxID=2972488 RepID=UPI002158D52A|nr:DUF1294 domain-containing protein [Paenibacillus radicibacter]MCR8643203.1 DUF1294 domain-containing protein [Paenibacillus radicibacter]
MNTLQLILIGLFIVMNFISYSTMASDKRRAAKNQRRIPEKKLFLLAACGGAIGSQIAMNRKRHKTKHLSFRLGIPLLILFSVGVYGYLLVLAQKL